MYVQLCLGGFVVSALVLILGFHCAKGRVKEEYIDEKAYPVQMSDYILKYFDENNIDIKEVRLYMNTIMEVTCYIGEYQYL